MKQSNLLDRFVSYEENGVLRIWYLMAGQDLKKNFAAQFPRKISCCKNYFEFSLKNVISVQIDIFTACHCKISNCAVQNLWWNKDSWSEYTLFHFLVE
jgi:hypothetical protein